MNFLYIAYEEFFHLLLIIVHIIVIFSCYFASMQSRYRFFYGEKLKLNIAVVISFLSKQINKRKSKKTILFTKKSQYAPTVWRCSNFHRPLKKKQYIMWLFQLIYKQFGSTSNFILKESGSFDHFPIISFVKLL